MGPVGHEAFAFTLSEDRESLEALMMTFNPVQRRDKGEGKIWKQGDQFRDLQLILK